MDDKFSPHIHDVAKALWGDANTKMSKPGHPRWGTHGARTIDIKRGIWADHEQNTGGGVLDLIMVEKGLSKAKAAKWMADEGYIESDRNDDRKLAPSNKDFGPRIDPDDPGYGSPLPDENRDPDPKAEIVNTYDYTDENGGLVYQVCRMEVPGRSDIPKTFRQRKPDGKGGWDWRVSPIGNGYVPI